MPFETSLFAFVVVAAGVMILVAVTRTVSRRRRNIFDLAEDVIEESLERSREHRRRATPPVPRGQMDFQCGHCGATQEGAMDVSPSGDVRCAYCGKWFNVHA